MNRMRGIAIVVAGLSLALASDVGAQAPPVPAPPGIAGRLLTLDEAVAIALASQPEIQARIQDYSAARFRVDQAVAPLLPQLAASSTTTHSQSVVLTTSPVTGVTAPVPVTREFPTTFQAQMTLSQLLFDFGKTFAAGEAARHLAEVARESVELQRQIIAEAVKEAYTNLLFAQRLLRVNQQALDRARLNLKSAEGFYEVGTRPRSDVTRAEVDVANARVDVIRARNAERLARVALNTAMAIDVDTPTQVQDNLVYDAVQLDRRALRQEALRQRPEYRQAKLQVQVAQANTRQASRNFLPTVSGTASFGGVTTQLSEAWAFGLALSWTLFDGGNLIAQYRQSQAALEATRLRVRASELDIIQAVEQAVISVEEAAERIQAAGAAVASAEENFRLAQGRFDTGVGTVLELTDAQLALTQTQNTEAQALSDYRIALYRLDRNVGRR